MIRTSSPPGEQAPSALRALRELNPKQPAAEFRPIRTIVDRAISQCHFFMLLVAAFAAVDLLLAALDIYRVTSYSVTKKTRETRSPHGAWGEFRSCAARRNLHYLAARMAGFVIGTIASAASARLIASLLFVSSPWDLAADAVTMLSLVAGALLSGYVPARRASTINPITALRSQQLTVARLTSIANLHIRWNPGTSLVLFPCPRRPNRNQKRQRN